MPFHSDFHEGCKISDVAEFPVIGEQCLDVERIRRVFRRYKGAIVGTEHGIVFALSSIRIDVSFFFCNVAVDNSNVLRELTNFIAAGSTFIDEIGLIPNISDEITGNGKFREDDDVTLFFFGFGNGFLHGFDITAWIASMDIQLS